MGSVTSPFVAGGPCPCRDCQGVFEAEDDHLLCQQCGYCPEEAFDHRIEDCPQCKSFAHIINQGNIICSGCTLELTAEDEETAITMWNSMPRRGPDAE
jgi:hypothetical protein